MRVSTNGRAEHDGRLTAFVESRSDRRATLHALIQEIFKAHTGARLKAVLALHSRKVNRIKLYGNADGRALCLAAKAAGQSRAFVSLVSLVRRLNACRSEAGGKYSRPAPIERHEQRQAQETIAIVTTN